MAKDYSFAMYGHPNIYNNYSSRELKVHFSEPDAGVNTSTGLVLFIPGFGGNTNSNVYKKMRLNFADNYNLVTVQCDYFGNEFMQYNALNETRSNFNDMGIMQALDNITAVTSVAEILNDNGLAFNTDKIMVYGQSHGGYLAYLCNIFAPDLFSLIIDNSAWLFPGYLKNNRKLPVDGQEVVFDYLAKKIIDDYEVLDLPKLYKTVANNCMIHSFHGVDDRMIKIHDKKKFCDIVNRCILHEITAANIDNKMFNSTSHSLGADFILLFDYVLTKINITFSFNNKIQINNHKIETSKYKYIFDYSNHNIPVLRILSK